MFRILVVEDDVELRELFRQVLEKNGYKVTGVPDGMKALDALDADFYDLIISDIMMPVMDGYELVRQLREANITIPVMMITAKDAFDDMRKGFLSGTDDYMVKPFALDELLARLRALTRRSKPATEAESKVLTFQDVTLDTQHREVTRDGQHISLTRTEFALLQVFMEHPRRVMERNTLLNEVWGFEFPTTANSLEVYIGYLRRKTEAGGKSRLIHTVRGIGYVLRETPP